MIFIKRKQCNIFILLIYFIIIYAQFVRSQAPPTDSAAKSSRLQDLIYKGSWHVITAPSRWLTNLFSSARPNSVTVSVEQVTTQSPTFGSLFSFWYPNTETTTVVATIEIAPDRGPDQIPRKTVKNGRQKHKVKSKSATEQLNANDKKRKALKVKIRQLQKDVKSSEGDSDRNNRRTMELQAEANLLFSERVRLKKIIAEQEGKPEKKESINDYSNFDVLESSDDDILFSEEGSSNKNRKRRKKGRLGSLMDGSIEDQSSTMKYTSSKI